MKRARINPPIRVSRVKEMHYDDKYKELQIIGEIPQVADGITYGILQGVGAKEFIGQQIRPYSIRFKALIRCLPRPEAQSLTFLGLQAVLISVVLDRQSNKGDPAYTDIFDTDPSGTTEFPVVENSNRFKILKQFWVNVSATSSVYDTTFSDIRPVFTLRLLEWYHEFSEEDATGWILDAEAAPVGNKPVSSQLRFCYNARYDDDAVQTYIEINTRFKWFDC